VIRAPFPLAELGQRAGPHAEPRLARPILFPSGKSASHLPVFGHSARIAPGTPTGNKEQKGNTPLTPQEIKVRENLARRQAKRRFGLLLVKSNRRDRLAPDFGLFALINPKTGKAINPPLERFVHSWTLHQVEAYLQQPHDLRKQPNPAPSPQATDLRSASK
jgi:hypothetical protein